MSKELQAVLKPGDQIIAIEDAYFPPHIATPPKLSQRKGDIIMVNNPRVGCDIVSGTGIHDGPGLDGRPSLGLGCSLRVGTFRMATYDDPGFMATREQWDEFRDAEINRLRAMVVGLGLAAFVSFGFMLMVVVS